MLSSEAGEWTENLNKKSLKDVPVLPLLPLYDCPSSVGLYKAETDLLPQFSGFLNTYFHFLSNKEPALKRPGHLPDAAWHGPQTVTCQGALSLYVAMLKSEMGENVKGSL